jgi:hypothetical protein
MDYWSEKRSSRSLIGIGYSHFGIFSVQFQCSVPEKRRSITQVGTPNSARPQHELPGGF